MHALAGAARQRLWEGAVDAEQGAGAVAGRSGAPWSHRKGSPALSWAQQ